MAQKVREIMTTNVVTLPGSAPVTEIVLADSTMGGLVTDRDIVLRAVAEGKDTRSASLEEICTHDVATVGPDDSIEQAIQVIRQRAVRRVPVVENGRPVGIVSIGDLAIERDEDSALADLSAAEGNN